MEPKKYTTEDIDEQESEDEEDFVYVDLSDIFNQLVKFYQITVLIRSLLTMNRKYDYQETCTALAIPWLIAMSDVDKISNVSIKKLKRKVEEKLQAICNKQSRGAVTIHKKNLAFCS